MYPLKLRFEIARISLRNGAVAQCSQIHHTHFHAYYYSIIIIIRYVYMVLLSDPIGNTPFCPYIPTDVIFCRFAIVIIFVYRSRGNTNSFISGFAIFAFFIFVQNHV